MKRMRRILRNLTEKLSAQRTFFYLSGIGVFLFSVLYESARGAGFAAGFIGIIFISWLCSMTSEKKKHFDLNPEAQLSRKGSGGIFCLCVVLLLSGFLVVSDQEDEWTQAVYQIEGTIYCLVRRISGTADEAISNGSISRGNNYRTGTVQLELEAMEKPTESIYLRGFSGGDYEDGEWKEADDDALIQNVVETLHWQEWLDMVRNMYYSMYFVLNMELSKRVDPDIHFLSVRSVEEDIHTFYMPYYSRWSRWKENSREGDKAGYDFEYYQQEDVSVDWEKQQEYLTEAAGWYQELQAEYQKEIQEAYTHVPRQDIPRLDRLVAENPLVELDEITSFILTTLAEHAVYTLTPGRIPVNRETVEYFLFESGEGYCQHFASAAVLMYRMYGVPARYAAGYLVDREMFTRQGDGSWSAQVTDESAHAWVEIFLEDYGWTPVEVTPSADGTITAFYPGLGKEAFPKTLKNTEDGFAISVGRKSDQKTEDVQAEKKSFGNSRKILDLPEYRKAFLMAGTLFIYALLLLPFFLDYRRLYRLEKLKYAGCCVIYIRWMEMLHFCGLLQGYHGLEDAFPDEAGKVSGISCENIMKMQEIVRKSTFSLRIPELDEERFVAECYCRSACFLKRHQKGIRKITFSYLKNYG